MPSSDTWNVESLRQHLDDKLRMLHEELVGFPETYSRRVELEALRSQVEQVRSDHIGREEFAEALKPIRAEQERAAGRRAAFAAVAFLLALGTTILWGNVSSSMLRHTDVSAQIKVEAPWVQDRPLFERRLSELEKENEALKIRLSREEALSRFFCRTRTPQLPGC